MLFSSPEQKVHWWAYRIGRPLSVVHTLFKQLFRNHCADWSQIFIWSLHGMWEHKFVQTGLVTWPRWPPSPYIVKTLEKKLPTKPIGRWPWNLVCSIGCSSTTKFVQMITLGWPRPILRQGQIWSLMLFVWEKGKTMDFSKTIVIYGLKLAIDDWSDEVSVDIKTSWGLYAPCPGAIYMY